MPAALPLIGAALISAGPLTLLGSAIAYTLILSPIAFGDRARRKANRAARAAWEASLRDRAITVRGAELPRSITYGRVKIGGELVYARSFGSLQDRLLMVVALRSGHELTEIETVYMGERSLGTLGGDGYPTDGPFVTSRSDNTDTVNSTADGNATRVVTLPNTPIAGSVTAQYATGSSGGDNGPAYEPLTIASVSGNDVTVNTTNGAGNLANGTAIYVQYLYAQTSTSWVRCKRYLGTDTQTADADAITDSGGEWTSNHRGRGVPALYLWFQYNQDLMPNGVENISAIVRGKKCFDPRTSTTVYTRNPALIARDYLTSSLGFGCSSAEIDDTLVIAAANECDEWVDLYNTGTVTVANGSNVVTGIGTNWKDWIQGQFFVGPDAVAYEIAGQFSPTELRLYSAYGGANASGASHVIRHRRYTCDVDLSTETARDENLQIILDAMAGYAVYSQGKWRLYAGAYTAPAVTLDESALADSESISIQARVPRAQLFNAVKGVYLSEKNAWQPADYPLVSNATYETQDGGERMITELNLPATNDAWMAQRLAKITLERSRQALTVRAAFNLKAYAVTPGDIIGLTLARYGFSNKPMRVIDREFDLARGVVLTLREEASGVYDWNSGEATEVDLAPNTNLPSPWTAPTMNALTLASGTAHLLRLLDGSVVTRISVTWSALADAYVVEGGRIEVEFRRLPLEDWQAVAPLTGDSTQVYLSPVEDGSLYQVRARALNSVGVRSQWVYSTPHQVVGKTEPPSNVTGLTTELTTNGILLKWDEAPDVDYAATELRVGASWATGLIITRKASRTHLWGWQPAGASTVWAKHWDSSGNESATAASVVVSVLAPAVPSLQATVIANNVLLNWSNAQTTQPVRRYLFREGSTWAGGADLGSAGGDSRFETYFFSTPGAKKIWIAAEDVAGNLGGQNSVDVTVTNALGFKLRADFASTFGGTKTNAAVQADGSLVALVNTTETWANHFSTRSWANSDAQVAAGYPLVLQPNTASASYQEAFDLTATFTAATTVSVTYGLQWLAGSGTVSVQVAVSNTSSTGPWTDLAAGPTVTTDVDFRWVRVTLSVAEGGGSNDLARLTGLAVRVSQQKLAESAVVACVSTDSGGTTFTFTEAFSGVSSIVATPVGTADRRAVIDFNYSASNPTTCKVLLFDSAGARVSGNCALYIEGFQ